MSDVTNSADRVKPRKPGRATARATGTTEDRKRVVFKLDDELFTLIKRFAMRKKCTLSQAIRTIVRARVGI